MADGGREPVKQIFVGGLDPNTSEEEIREHFSQYGMIESLQLPFDKSKNQRKAFGFVTFDSEETTDKACAQPKQDLGGRHVDVKKVNPNHSMEAGRGGRGMQRGRFMRGARGATNGYGGYGAYDFGGGYADMYGYGSYDPAGYYGQSWGSGYPGGYGYAPPPPPHYAAGGYDYSYYGQTAAGPAQRSNYGKTRRGGPPGAGGYHPYSR